jgi:hypothetical protein
MIITFPPNGALQLIISCKDLSKASKQYLCIMGASSQMIAVVLLMSFARLVFLPILQKERGSITKGIPNLECAVLPPGNSVAAIPDEAVEP